MSQLLFKFLHFRLKQVGRIIKEIGVFRILLVLSILLIYIISQPSGLPNQDFLILPFYLILVLPFHFSRRDQGFLKKLDPPKEYFFAAEYNVIVLPLSLFLAYHQRWEAIFLGHLLASIIVFLPSVSIGKVGSKNDRFIRWIPQHLFEWRSAFRQQKFFFGSVFLVTALLSTFTYTIPIGILIFLISLPEVFNHMEPKELIETYPKSSAFLSSKLVDHSLLIHLLFLPLYGLFLGFHSHQWYVIIFLIVLTECSICFCLLYKYSWFHYSTPSIQNQIPFALFFFSTILFLPAGFLFIYVYWKRARNAVPEYVNR